MDHINVGSTGSNLQEIKKMFHTIVNQCKKLKDKDWEVHITKTNMHLAYQLQAFMGVDQQLQDTDPIVYVSTHVLENWLSYYGIFFTDMQKTNSTLYDLKLRRAC